MATVYRTLNALLEQQRIVPVDLPGEPPRYEKADLPHHHHFRCDACGRVYDLDGCALRQPVRLPAGFQALRHDLTVYGLCAGCGI
jgi:Fur family ferric uptake transcriptional regulator